MEDSSDFIEKVRTTYFTELGKFIDEFSETESALADILERMTKVDTLVGRALFSGVRAEAATKYIARLQEALKSPPEDRNEIQAIFTQLGIITLIRNDIVHYGTNFYGPGPDYAVTNKRVALSKSRLRDTPVSAKILRDLTRDLKTINARLRLYWAKGLKSEFMAHETWGEHARRPWRYKPSPPASQGKQRRSKSPKRQRQPRPSQQ